MCNARFIFIKLLMEKIIVTLMKFLDLDDVMENIKQTLVVICRKLSTSTKIILKMCIGHVVGF
jgi:hypothetical protein